MPLLLLYPSFTSPRAWALCSLVGLSLAGCGGGGGADGSAGGGNVQTEIEQPLSITPEPVAESAPPAETSFSTTTLSTTTLNYLTQLNVAALRMADVMEDFNTQTAADGSRPTGWAFNNGSEFSGAQGALMLTSGSSGRQAELQGDLGCGTTTVIVAPASGCGKYVAALRYFPTPFEVTAPYTSRVQLRFKLTEPMLAVGLRLTDSTGQTLQYNVPANTLESVAGNTWTQVAIPVTQPASYWGGAQSGHIQGPLKQMSVLLNQKTLVGPRGSLLLDGVSMLKTETAHLALTGDEAMLSNGVIPSVKGRMAVTARYYKISDASLKLAAEAGFSVVRVDMFWDSVERDGVFDFSIYETVLNRLAAYGMKALFILNYGHPDHGHSAPLTAQDRNAFIEYARRATYFAKNRNVIGFEVWNEPDHNVFWSEGNPQTYAQLLEPTRAAIKAIDPARVVMNGGTSWVNMPYILELAKTGSLSKLDAFAVHPYRKTANPESFAADLATLRFTLKEYGVQAPVWVTEWGHSSAGLAAETYGNGFDPRARSWQARMVMRSQLSQIALNMPLMTTYELVDSGTDPTQPEHNYGLVNTKLEPKPAYTALKQLYSLIKDKAYQGLVRDVPPHVHAMRWKGNNKTVYALWLDSGSLTATFTVPAQAQILDWDGALKASATGPGETRSITLNRDGGLIYVVL